MAELFRYAAFISYSSKDARFARRLHRMLEAYRIPAKLGAFDLVGGGKKNRVYPVFRDREELSAGALNAQIEAAVRASAALIVVCSPHAAASPWVEQEIQLFKALGRQDRIAAIITDSAPLADDQGADATAKCFPSALVGEQTDGHAKVAVLAADARKGKDGFRNAALKVIAGLIGVTAGTLADRDRKRRQAQRAQAVAGASAAAAVLAIAGASLHARDWRTDLTQQASALALERRHAEAAAFALGGGSASGALLGFRDNNADAVLRQTGAARMGAELGPINNFSVSANGAALFFQRRDAGETGAVMSLASGATTELSALGPLIRYALSADGGTLLVHRDDQIQSGAVIDTKTGTKLELGGLGALRNFALSADGAHAAFFPSAREARAWRLDVATGATNDLGRLRLFIPTPSGANLLVQTDAPQSTWAVVDWARPTPRDLGALGSVRTFTTSLNGEMLVIQRADEAGTAVAIDLTTGTRTEWALGPIQTFQLSENGDFLALQRDDRDNTLEIRDLRSGNVTELGAYGRLEGVEISADGGLLALTRAQDARTSALINVKTLAQTELGRVWGFHLAAKGDRVVVLRDDEVRSAAVYLPGSGEVIEFGALGAVGNSALGASDTTLVVYRPDGTAATFDFEQPVNVSSAGANLVKAVCAANANSLRPLGLDAAATPERDASAAESDARRGLQSILLGRPWNPCDWRGLGAVFPDAERGDGWFEGARQWLRLMQIRHLGGDDLPCDATTSQASAETRTARAKMCRMFPQRRSPQ